MPSRPPLPPPPLPSRPLLQVRRQRSPHQKAQSDYVSCGSATEGGRGAPTFVGHTESLDADWQRLRAAFAPEIALADAHRRKKEGAENGVPLTLPHRHNQQERDGGPGEEEEDEAAAAAAA